MIDKEKVFGFIETHLRPPRHDFEMNKGRGIREHIGLTIVLASFTRVHGKSVTEIDVHNRENAAWLTTPKEIDGQMYDFIIGPNGKASIIAIGWDQDKPVIFFQSTDSKMQRLDGVKENKMTFRNCPVGTNAALLQKIYYPHSIEFRQRETYSILKLPSNYQLNSPDNLNYFAAQETLVSGMNNRGLGNRLSTSFWAVSNSDMRYVPFRRGLKIK